MKAVSSLETCRTMTKRLKIWSDNSFAESQAAERQWICDALAMHDFRLFELSENGQQGASARFLAAADIAFGAPAAKAVLKAEHLAWVQVNSAGYAAYDSEDFKREMKRRGTIFTNSSSVYDEACAQHLLAMILSLARRLPFCLDAQGNEKSWKSAELRSKIHLLNEQIVLIFGFGAIAERLIELLVPLKMNIIGVRRKIQKTESVQIVTGNEAQDYLPLADHIINILPENIETKNYFNALMLSKIKAGACFYNIGRSTTVDQEALIRLLEQRKIAAAYLDVTNPEPLPPAHPLWTTPNCYITPHIAGGSADEKKRQVKHFLANLARFQKNEELIDRII